MGVRFGWTASTDNVGVTFYEIAKGVGSTTVYGTSSTLEFTDNNVSGSSVTYRVRAADAAGNRSGWSGSATFSTSDTTPPTVPGSFTGTSSTASGATLVWNQGKWDQNTWG